jgi:histidyl-tRNA synthetase
MNSTPSIPQGTRDFDAETIRKRNFILTTIKNVFEIYGYQPLETPAFENLQTLLGKYGEEGDKLIFKILNNGLNHEKNIARTRAGFDLLLEGKNSVDITERALKYDLTIPFARYVAMNHTKLVFPFKRYQVQNVWRADRPQKGRYREFTQCDADVVGSHNLLNDAEFAMIYDEAFRKLGLPDYELRINSRKILEALAMKCNAMDKLVKITTIIDKLDKSSWIKLKLELLDDGLNEEQLQIIEEFISISGSNDEKIEQAIKFFGTNEKAALGLEEIIFIQKKAKQANISVDFSLARGLNYYTGIIFEAKAPSMVQMGSIGGGGRYDDLTGLFGVDGIPGVGISFGVDRIYDVMEELDIFPKNLQTGTKVIFFNMGPKESEFSFGIMQQLRRKGISCELFLEEVKLQKQFSYAERKKIPFAIIIGSKEIEQNYCQVKNINTQEQHIVVINNLVAFLTAQE